MKKRKRIMLALFVSILLGITQNAVAAEIGVTPYARSCPMCNNALRYREYTYDKNYYVSNCSNSPGDHIHTDRVHETGYICATFGCPTEGFYVDVRTEVLYTTCSRQ